MLTLAYVAPMNGIVLVQSLRCVGFQVRAAATIGGNLVLTRSRGLESDLATLLIAAGAQVNLWLGVM